jgi:hypothetical protein
MHSISTATRNSSSLSDDGGVSTVQTDGYSQATVSFGKDPT